MYRSYKRFSSDSCKRDLLLVHRPNVEKPVFADIAQDVTSKSLCVDVCGKHVPVVTTFIRNDMADVIVDVHGSKTSSDQMLH